MLHKIRRLKPGRKKKFILWFDEINVKDVPLVGGKNANLGEMYNKLRKRGIRIPAGFAITASAYKYLIKETGLDKQIKKILKGMNYRNIKDLQERGKKIRQLFLKTEFPDKLKKEILRAYKKMPGKFGYEKNMDVAVRSSATAEDLPSISKDEHILVTIDGKPVYKRMEELYNLVGDGSGYDIKIPAMQDYNIKWLKVGEIYKHKAKDRDKLYKITTSTGREITISPNHTLIVLDENTLEAKEVKSINELKGNEKLPVINNLPLLNVKDKYISVLDYISGGDIVLDNNYIKIKNKSTNWKIQQGLSQRIKVDRNFAYFLGLYCAEGTTYLDNGVIITNSNSNVRVRAINFLESINLYHNQKINKHSIRVYCKALVRFLNSVAGTITDTKGKGKILKKVPDFVFGWNQKLIGEFLKGCFDGDGCIENECVSYCSTSRILTGGIIKLIEMLGIEWHLRQRKAKLQHRKDAYEIKLPLRESNKFSKLINSESTTRQQKLIKLIEKFNSRSFAVEFKSSLTINKTLSNRLRALLEAKLDKQLVNVSLCPCCSHEIAKNNKYKGLQRFYCYDCHRSFYESEINKVTKEKYIYYNENGQFKKGAIPWNKGYNSKRMSIKQFKKLLNEHNLNDKFKSMNDSIRWDEIKKIERLEYDDYVYDFSVPEVENFASGIGGVITHNSASFAGQQETYLNIRGPEQLLDSCRKCFASLFTDRAISYREDKGFDHVRVYLSIGIQKMVRSDLASSGVMFTLDTESGFRGVVFINSAYGLGENVVQGIVNPDEFYVHKPTLHAGYKPIITKNLGDKKYRLIYSGSGLKNVKVPESQASEFSLTDEEILQLAKWACEIEAHYGRPMDIEWGKDGRLKKLFILQARPETVHALKKEGVYEEYVLKKKGKVLVTGHSVGEKIGSGKARIVRSIKELKKVKKGDVLVADMTNPDFEPIMKVASAIVTNQGGRVCHAAILSRELGIPCIVGTGNATKVLKNGRNVTVVCSEGDIGYVYDGLLKYEIEKIDLKTVPKTRTKVMMNVGLPDNAFEYAQLPNDGVGLAREEFIINSEIGIHPLALVHYEELKKKHDAQSQQLVRKIDLMTKGYKDKEWFYVDKLAQGIGRIAAAFYPKPVIVRLSDFKSNEYRNLVGGELFEPSEDNPMIGWRGAARYYTPAFRPAFDLECHALRIVRDEFGLRNVKIMVPFCRTVKEGIKVIRILGENGLKKGVNGLQIYVMCEIPSNVLLARKFARIFDGFSIGSNDLTQLTLGVDRDSSLVSSVYDERNDAVEEMIKHVIKTVKEEGKKIGICGQAASDFPDFVEFLVKNKIDSVSLNPDTVVKTKMQIARVERKLRQH